MGDMSVAGQSPVAEGFVRGGLFEAGYYTEHRCPGGRISSRSDPRARIAVARTIGWTPRVRGELCAMALMNMAVAAAGRLTPWRGAW